MGQANPCATNTEDSHAPEPMLHKTREAISVRTLYTELESSSYLPKQEKAHEAKKTFFLLQCLVLEHPRYFQYDVICINTLQLNSTKTIST